MAWCDPAANDGKLDDGDALKAVPPPNADFLVGDGGDNPLEDGPGRYLGYAARGVRTLLLTTARAAKQAHRYIAYSSDVGEAFRPVWKQRSVKAAYGVAFAYVAADVGYNVYTTHNETNGDRKKTVRKGIETLTFQALASLALPSLIIHTAVHQSHKIFHKSASVALKKWGPVAVGLAIIPALPFTIDEPCEHACEAGFERLWPWWDGLDVSRRRPGVSRGRVTDLPGEGPDAGAAKGGGAVVLSKGGGFNSKRGLKKKTE